MYQLIILSVLSLLMLTGCGDTPLTNNQMTNPKDYLWSGGVGSEYQYDNIYILRDKDNLDTILTSNQATYVIVERDTPNTRNDVIGITIRRVIEDTIILNQRYFASNSLLWEDGQGDSIRQLVVPLAVGTVFQSSLVSKTKITSANDEVSVPAGKFKCIRLEEELPSFDILNDDGTKIAGPFTGKYTYWYAPNYNLVKMKYEGIDTSQTPRTKWIRYSISQELRSVSRK